jgi:predicted transposase YbfD/YdcC
MISPAGDLRQFMAQVPDPRGRKGTRHPLSAILTAVICAVLSGANGYKPIAQWLHTQSVDFWHFLGFTRRPIRYVALRNLLMTLDPRSFEDALLGWLQQAHGPSFAPEKLSAVAIDGKTLRGTQALDQRALMLIAAFDHETACVIRQHAVPADTNEQKAVLDLLKQLVLTGRVVTADALHCQQETCQQIADSGGHYVLTVKENQPTLRDAISLEFTAQQAAFSPLRPARTARRTAVVLSSRQGQRSAGTPDAGKHDRAEPLSSAATRLVQCATGLPHHAPTHPA